jgi:hypothetical protein
LAELELVATFWALHAFGLKNSNGISILTDGGSAFEACVDKTYCATQYKSTRHSMLTPETEWQHRPLNNSIVLVSVVASGSSELAIRK